MNAAVPLVRSRLAAGAVDIVRLMSHLERLMPLHAGGGWDEEPLQFSTERAALDRLALVASELAQTQTLDEMRESGRASLLLFTDDELEQALADVPTSEIRPSGRWLEAESLPEGRWIAYPQDESPEVRLVVWLPVASGPAVTRLVALDTGVDVTTGEARAPSTGSGGCDVGFSREGGNMTQVCVRGDCAGGCDEKWQYRQGDFVLVSCPC